MTTHVKNRVLRGTLRVAHTANICCFPHTKICDFVCWSPNLACWSPTQQYFFKPRAEQYFEFWWTDRRAVDCMTLSWCLSEQRVTNLRMIHPTSKKALVSKVNPIKCHSNDVRVRHATWGRCWEFASIWKCLKGGISTKHIFHFLATHWCSRPLLFYFKFEIKDIGQRLFQCHQSQNHLYLIEYTFALLFAPPWSHVWQPRQGICKILWTRHHLTWMFGPLLFPSYYDIPPVTMQRVFVPTFSDMWTWFTVTLSFISVKGTIIQILHHSVMETKAGRSCWMTFLSVRAWKRLGWT